MRLKNIFHYLERWKQTRRLETTKKLLSQYLQDKNIQSSTESILLMLRDNIDRPFDNKLALSIRVKSTLPDFSQLNRLLILINHDLSNDHVLSASRSGGQIEEYSLDRLFIDNEGRYINWLQVTSFCEEALKMCKLTEGYEQYTHGTEEHNLRMLSKVFVTVRSISSGLLEVLLI